MKTLFLGDTPSKTNTDPNTAFVGAKCYKTLLGWINQLNLTDYDLKNRVDQIDYTRYNRIVALGNNASKHLDKLQLSYFKLPHPSGRNRVLNDKYKISEYLDQCKQFLNKE